MKLTPKYPSLYQINTRVWLTELSGKLGRRATLDDIPDTELDNLAAQGFDWIWFLSVWTTGEAGCAISRQNPEWQQEFRETLPDLEEQDIAGSGFSIADYKVHQDIGGDAALKRLRKRLKSRGLKLMLDFVPNHMGPDHRWVVEHPEYFVSGTEIDLERQPQNYTKIKRKGADLIFAYGRDPYFSGWPDTIQLDYSNPATVEAMTEELLRISGQCDGLRCDMAMLILPEIFEQTWGRRAESFWPTAITMTRKKVPGFYFMAEVYWDMEWTLQHKGFDYTYDKRLYDRLTMGNAGTVREHLTAGLDYQDKLARFLENHDEPRAAATFEDNNHEAAAVITFLSPGLRFFHQGQFEGKKVRISPHLIRAPQELANPVLQKFYSILLSVLKSPVFRSGCWELLECIPAWEGNSSWNSYLAFAWTGLNCERVLVCVNYAPDEGQCFVLLPFPALDGQMVRFSDKMSDAVYDRDGNDLKVKGLYLNMPPWGYHVFELGIPEEVSFRVSDVNT